MRTFTAQFKMPGNIGIGTMDPDSAQAQKILSDEITNHFLSGNVQLTQVQEFFTELNDHKSEKDETSGEPAIFVDINLCLNDAEGRHYKKHKAAITRKAVDTLRNSKMFLSYLWQKKNTEHIGLETIFV